MSLVSGATCGINMSWFSIKGKYAVAKSESKPEISKALASKKQQDTDALHSFMDSVRKNGVKVDLSDEQRQMLSEKYNPTDMTHEDYRNLVDDLCEMGILGEGDKDYLAYSGLTRLDLSGPVCEITKGCPGKPMYDFADCNGNVLEWSKYRASFEYFDAQTNSFQKSRSAILFGKLETVLKQIGG